MNYEKGEKKAIVIVCYYSVKLFVRLFDLHDSLRPINNLSVKQVQVTSTKLESMCLARGPQCSDTDEARTCSPSVSSQALYHWATALPLCEIVYMA